MKKVLVILHFAVIATTFSFAQDIVGDWNGTLHVNGRRTAAGAAHQQGRPPLAVVVFSGGREIAGG